MAPGRNAKLAPTRESCLVQIKLNYQIRSVSLSKINFQGSIGNLRLSEAKNGIDNRKKRDKIFSRMLAEIIYSCKSLRIKLS